MENLRISIVDDDDAFRAALIKQLQQYNCYSFCYTSGRSEEALLNILRLNCDIVILDYLMPVVNGIQLTKALRNNHFQGKIIMLTSFQDEFYFKEFTDIGADFCHSKNKISEIAESLHSFIFHKQAIIKSNYTLTPNETKIIIEICNDLTNQEIADKLYLSKRTIETYRHKIAEKLCITNSTVSFVKYAISQGYYSLNKEVHSELRVSS